MHYLAEAGDAADQESSSEDSVGCTDACCADIDAYGREVPVASPTREIPRDGGGEAAKALWSAARTSTSVILQTRTGLKPDSSRLSRTADLHKRGPPKPKRN